MTFDMSNQSCQMNEWKKERKKEKKNQNNVTRRWQAFCGPYFDRLFIKCTSIERTQLKINVKIIEFQTYSVFSASTKMNTRYWSDAQTSELIQLLEKNECLWNPNCPQYRDRTKRGLALAKMAIKLKHSAKQIRTKIKNLRSQYTTIRVKMRQTSSKKSPWKYYSALHFMFENAADDINYDDTMDVKVSWRTYLCAVCTQTVCI